MRILWYNWRDIKSPDAGGAEVFTHEIIRRLAKRGHEITLFSAGFPNCLPREQIDGLTIVRAGGKYTVYHKAKNYYKKFGQSYDLIIDEVNTRPFLTPKFVEDKPIITVIHQLAREFWFYETPFPLNYFGYYFLEEQWLSHYKNIPTITVSNSSKNDLESLGFNHILMVPEGLNVAPLMAVPKKESKPTVVFFGRLKKAKLPDHAIHAFSIIKKSIPNAQMWVIGDGYMRKKLERYNVPDITFYGFVTNEQKYSLLSKAHLALVPAVREGWGLVVTESNAMGTPAVAYDVPGLRDSVKNGETGLLVKTNDPEGLASAAISLLSDTNLINKFSSNALAFSKEFNWDNTAMVFDNIIKKVTVQ